MKKSPSKAMVLTTVILMDILAGAELDLFVPSFPELQAKFNLTPFWVEALLTVNFIGLCISLFFVGALADRYGRRPIILGGLIVFIIGTLSCLFAPNYIFLLAGRFLQGLGAAAPGTLCFLIIADNYSLKEQQYMMALLNGIINATMGAAPVAGSYITLFFHWQGNFITLLIFGILVLILTLLFVPQNKLPEEKETLSIKGYFPIFQSKPVMLLLCSLIFLWAPYWIFVGMSPLLYIQDLGVSLAHFGFYQGVFCVVFAFGSIIFGLVLHKLNQKLMMNLTLGIFIFSIVALAWVTLTDLRDPLIITLAFLIFVIGQIVPSVILYPVYLHLLPKAKGKMSALMRAGTLILTGFSLQLAGHFYTGSFQNIGIILLTVIIIGTVGFYLIIKNPEIHVKG